METLIAALPFIALAVWLVTAPEDAFAAIENTGFGPDQVVGMKTLERFVAAVDELRFLPIDLPREVLRWFADRAAAAGGRSRVRSSSSADSIPVGGRRSSRASTGRSY